MVERGEVVAAVGADSPASLPCGIEESAFGANAVPEGADKWPQSNGGFQHRSGQAEPPPTCPGNEIGREEAIDQGDCSNEDDGALAHTPDYRWSSPQGRVGTPRKPTRSVSARCGWCMRRPFPHSNAIVRVIRWKEEKNADEGQRGYSSALSACLGARDPRGAAAVVSARGVLISFSDLDIFGRVCNGGAFGGNWEWLGGHGETAGGAGGRR